MQKISKYRKFAIKQAKEFALIRKKLRNRPLKKSKVSKHALKDLEGTFLDKSYKRSYSVKQLLQEQINLQKELFYNDQSFQQRKQQIHSGREDDSLIQRTRSSKNYSTNSSVIENNDRSFLDPILNQIKEESYLLKYPKLFTNRRASKPERNICSQPVSPSKVKQSFFFKSKAQKLTPVQTYLNSSSQMQNVHQCIDYLKPKSYSAFVADNQRIFKQMKQKDIPYNEAHEVEQIKVLKILKKNPLKADY